MKKLLALILVLLCCISTAYAETDYSSIPLDELKAQYDAIRNELFKRGMIFDGKTVLFEQDGVTVYLTGKYEVKKNWQDEYILELEAVVINNYSTVINVGMDNWNASVNGWDVYADGISSTNPGKKQKGMFEIKLSDADITTYEEIEEIEFQFYLYDFDNWETVSNVAPVTVYFNK